MNIELESLNNEVLALYQQGDYDSAIMVAKKALQVTEQVLGPNHNEVAECLNSLTLLYDTQGQYAEAEQYFKRSISIKEETLGPDHPEIATSLNCRAKIYYTQNQYTLAESLLKSSLAIREKSLGPDHPDVAETLRNLAVIYFEQAQYTQAEPLYIRSLSIYEKALGPDHPDVAQCLENMIDLYWKTGRAEAAENTGQRINAIWDKLELGKVGPEIIMKQCNKKPDINFYRDGSGNVTRIESADLSGECRVSSSGEWIISWNNFYVGGRDLPDSYGFYTLYNLPQRKIFAKGKLERPDMGSVADNGSFCLVDLHNSTLTGTLHIFDQNGEQIYTRKFEANIYRIAISNGGLLAICQTANNPLGNDGNLLSAFDLTKRIELFSIHPKCWADGYEFIEESQTFIILINKIGKFRYDSLGNFIDKEHYDLSRLNCELYYEILNAAEEILLGDAVESKQIELVLDSIIKARALISDNDNYWKSKTFKLQGIALDKMDRLIDALEAYEQALRIDSTCGVKRRAASIRKKLATITNRKNV